MKPSLFHLLAGSACLAGLTLSGSAYAADSDGDGIDDATDTCPCEDASAADIDGDGCSDESLTTLAISTTTHSAFYAWAIDYVDDTNVVAIWSKYGEVVSYDISSGTPVENWVSAKQGAGAGYADVEVGSVSGRTYLVDMTTSYTDLNVTILDTDGSLYDTWNIEDGGHPNLTFATGLIVDEANDSLYVGEQVGWYGGDVNGLMKYSLDGTRDTSWVAEAPGGTGVRILDDCGDGTAMAAGEDYFNDDILWRLDLSDGSIVAQSTMNADDVTAIVCDGGSFWTLEKISSSDYDLALYDEDFQLVDSWDTQPDGTDWVRTAIDLGEDGIFVAGTRTLGTSSLDATVAEDGSVSSYNTDDSCISTVVDTDGDGVDDDNDAFPNDPTETADTDGDGVGDNADAFPYDASESADTDGDGVGDNADLFPTDPLESTDGDGDGVGDNSDPCSGFPNVDEDGDEVCDSDDPCPTDASDTDEDEDGVCDVEDICMGSDNVDSDGDQICDDIDVCEGNDATGDQDSDGFCDEADNCPLDANADQSDTDGDDIGDVCEADTDADGVIDDDDNCSAVPNSDQSDLDGDGEGDVCDSDDDNDGVADDSDNCPFYDNADQTDTDGDGYGDECDGDDDADGIADEDDACPGTPLDASFNGQGCSGEQIIELKCGSPADYGWTRRGKYKKCVVKKSKRVWRKGLITRKERGMIIRRAMYEWWTHWISRLIRWC